MYKYKITLKVLEVFYYTVSTESDWIADEETAFHELHGQILFLQEKYPNWEQCKTTMKLYSDSCRYLRKSWNTREYNWGVE